MQKISGECSEAAQRIAMQLSDGSLDNYPMDKKAAEAALRRYLDAGDITEEDIRKCVCRD